MRYNVAVNDYQKKDLARFNEWAGRCREYAARDSQFAGNLDKMEASLR